MPVSSETRIFQSIRFYYTLKETMEQLFDDNPTNLQNWIGQLEFVALLRIPPSERLFDATAKLCDVLNQSQVNPQKVLTEIDSVAKLATFYLEPNPPPKPLTH